jgi:phosphate/sulfate permease
MFSFKEVMFIFIAVMITDVLLLDVFNSLGLPTSTTVSVVFSLLGSAVCIGLYHIITKDGSFTTLPTYINTEKVSEIIYSILLSVLLSFLIGALVQYIARIVFTFDINKRVHYIGGIFGGLAISAIIYFIFFKGLKSSTLLSADAKDWMKTHQLLFVGLNFALWTIVSQVLISAFKQNIFKIIIVVGTFALALAFAGNDLVNFIGVFIGGLDSFGIYMENGKNPDMLMGQLAIVNDPANLIFILIAGLIMVYTLWTSKKTKTVVETSLNLSRQSSDGEEKFSSNFLSRIIVRGVMYIGLIINRFLPKSLQLKIEKQFQKPILKTIRTADEPMFDMVRASVNLMVASVLIAMGTTMKLPLSTTYVTFMVAMGTSFADRAWDRESAVFRVAGVLNVIGGWFVTAIVAFLFSASIALLLKFGEIITFVGLIILVAIALYKSKQMHTKATKAKEEKQNQLRIVDIITIKEVVFESSKHISNIVGKVNKIYTSVVNGLGLEDLSKIKDSKKELKKLEKEVEDLKGNVYYFIRNLDETSVEASKFYVLVLGLLQDMVQSVGFITQNSYSHVDNNHKKLKFNQIRDLKTIEVKVKQLFKDIEEVFKTNNFEKIDQILAEKEETLKSISELIEKQIERIRTTETSPKNSKLYFSILLETNDLVNATMKLLELFKEFNLHKK